MSTSLREMNQYTLSEFIEYLKTHEPEHGDKIVVSGCSDDNGIYYSDEMIAGTAKDLHHPDYQMPRGIAPESCFLVTSIYS